MSKIDKDYRQFGIRTKTEDDSIEFYQPSCFNECGFDSVFVHKEQIQFFIESIKKISDIKDIGIKKEVIGYHVECSMNGLPVTLFISDEKQLTELEREIGSIITSDFHIESVSKVEI